MLNRRPVYISGVIIVGIALIGIVSSLFISKTHSETAADFYADELAPIPAICLVTSRDVLALQLLIAKNIYPITVEQYRTLYAVPLPKGAMPVVCLNRSHERVTLSVLQQVIDLPAETATLNRTFRLVPYLSVLPVVYSRAYDPDDALEIGSIQALINQISTGSRYVSDGVTGTITFPLVKKDELFFYAPTSGISLMLTQPGLPATSSIYYTKKQTFAFKKISQRGIYLTATSFLNRAFLEDIFVKAKNSPLDSLIIDAKDIYHIESLNEDLEQKPIFKTVKELVALIHAHGLKASARVWVFQDNRLGQIAPQVMIRSKTSNQMWRDRGGMAWADPFNEEAIAYTLKFVKTNLDAGFDEIQFDYIRFPTDGDVKNLVFPANTNNLPRYKAITYLLDKAAAITSARNKSLTIDIFGVAVWPRQPDSERLGQRVWQIARYVDAICPMLYPSHFGNGYDGKAYPGDEPYFFLNRGTSHLKNINRQYGNADVLAIPWIQGFGWRTHIFGPKYIADQIKGLTDAGGDGFLVWNAGNQYRDTFEGISDIK